jgi:hypothetical protein
VFASGWTHEAAEAVCGGDSIDEPYILDVLSQLVAKSRVVSLAHTDTGRPQARFRDGADLAAPGRLPIDQYHREPLYVRRLGPFDCLGIISEIVDCDVAARAGDSLHQFHNRLTDRTSGREDLDLPLSD